MRNMDNAAGSNNNVPLKHATYSIGNMNCILPLRLYNQGFSIAPAMCLNENNQGIGYVESSKSDRGIVFPICISGKQR